MTEERTAELIQRMIKSRPKEFLQEVDATNAGIGCVLRFLNESGRAVSAGEISDAVKVSTARMAVMLRKMHENGWILKLCDPSDARRSMITLSAEGKRIILEKQRKMMAYFGYIIEQIGEERFEEFIKISEEIKAAIDEKKIATILSE